MKKTFIAFIGLLISVSGFAQIYQNKQDKGVLWAWPDQSSNPATVIEYSSSGITIAPNGSHPQYQPAGGIGIGETLNVEAAPTLYVKAKGTGSPTFRIDLTDSNGFDTSGAEVSVNLSEEYEIHTFQFKGNFKDRYSAACSNLPQTFCDTDPTNIVGMNFFVNAGTGNYKGTVAIEWMSFGESLEDLVQGSTFDVRYNRIGYTVDQSKSITIVANGEFDKKGYTVYDSNNKNLLSGTTGDAELWGAAEEYAYTIDVSEINEEGTYKFVIDEKEITFKVTSDPYTDIRKEAFKYYYYNRASTELTQQYAGDYARPTGIADTDVKIHKSAVSPGRPEGFSISAPKGWYDAGDYNKYIVNSGISTYTLLAAFEHYSAYFSNTAFSIPETGGDLPDILDEAKWNLDWMLAMQDPYDGGVYHKLTGLNFSDGNVSPSSYSFERYVVKKSTSAALDFAAVMATAARIFENYDATYSTRMLDAAKSAYTWAKNNPAEFYLQPNMSGAAGDPILADVLTGEYQDASFDDEFQWAASELYITTEDVAYANDIEINSINGGVPGWQNVATLALYSLTNATNLPSNVISSATANFLDIADTYKSRIENSGMSVAMSGADFVWGSNGVAGNQIMLLIYAYKITEDRSYLDAAYAALDYMFGRNGTGYSYVTGFGDLSPTDPHHRISYADNVTAPIPGMVVGGPHSSVSFPLDGECELSDYPVNLEPAKTYFDGWCSYATNEVTINWNAPIVYALHALRALQIGNVGELSTADNFNEAFAEKFAVYPNPSLDKITIASKQIGLDSEVKIFSLIGKEMFSTALDSDSTTIDLSKIAKGVYLMQISTDNQNYTTKIVKE